MAKEFGDLKTPEDWVEWFEEVDRKDVDTFLRGVHYHFKGNLKFALKASRRFRNWYNHDLTQEDRDYIEKALRPKGRVL